MYNGHVSDCTLPHITYRLGSISTVEGTTLGENGLHDVVVSTLISSTQLDSAATWLSERKPICLDAVSFSTGQVMMGVRS